MACYWNADSSLIALIRSMIRSRSSGRVVRFNELPVPRGQPGEFRDNDVLGTRCDSDNLPTIDFDFQVTARFVQSGGKRAVSSSTPSM